MLRSVRLKQRLNKIREKRLQPKERGPIDFPQLANYKGPVLSNKIDGLCPKHDKLTEGRWKKGKQETEKTIKEMQKKAKKIRPLYSKGGYSYPSDGDNTGVLTIHRK